MSADFFWRVNSSKLAASEVCQPFGQVSTCQYVGQLLTPLWYLPRKDAISPNESETTTKESKNGCSGFPMVCAWLLFWCYIFYCYFHLSCFSSFFVVPVLVYRPIRFYLLNYFVSMNGTYNQKLACNRSGTNDRLGPRRLQRRRR